LTESLFFIFALCQFSLQQTSTQVDRLVVDNYSEGFQTVLIELTTDITGNNYVNQTSFYTSPDGASSANILGGERDLLYSAQVGSVGRVFSTSVSVAYGVGQWEVSGPNGGSGQALCQYDGIDGSINLDRSGLGGIDITENGKGVAFHVIANTDIDTTYIFSVYSATGAPCTSSVAVPGGDLTLDTIVPFSGFTTTCDFTNVEAIELLIESFENVDTTTELFTTYGEADTTATSPSASPAPGPAGNGFTWYTVDDDFDRLPCADEPPRRSYFVSNQNIVYYYFYKFDEYVNAYYGSQLIVQISSSPALSISMFAGIVAILALY